VQFVTSLNEKIRPADSVEKLVTEAGIVVAILLKRAFRSGVAGLSFSNAVSVRSFGLFAQNTGDTCAAGGPVPRYVAMRLRFCAVAVRRNSSLAPLKPRNRRRSIFRMRFMCANSISTCLRCCLVL